MQVTNLTCDYANSEEPMQAGPGQNGPISGALYSNVPELGMTEYQN